MARERTTSNTEWWICTAAVSSLEQNSRVRSRSPHTWRSKEEAVERGQESVQLQLGTIKKKRDGKLYKYMELDEPTSTSSKNNKHYTFNTKHGKAAKTTSNTHLTPSTVRQGTQQQPMTRQNTLTRIIHTYTRRRSGILSHAFRQQSCHGNAAGDGVKLQTAVRGI